MIEISGLCDLSIGLRVAGSACRRSRGGGRFVPDHCRNGLANHELFARCHDDHSGRAGIQHSVRLSEGFMWSAGRCRP